MHRVRQGGTAALLLVALTASTLSLETSSAQTLLGKIVLSEPQQADFFGSHISLSGERMLVIGRDQVYVFERNGETWFHQATIVDPATPEPGVPTGFGSCISLSGRWAVVGSGHEKVDGHSSGAAYVFEWTGRDWKLRDRMAPPDPASARGFGSSCSVDGRWAFVGAATSEGGGAAHVFEWSGSSWDHVQKLGAPEAAGGFGRAIDVQEHRALISARYSLDSGVVTGSAYVYEWDGTQWHPKAALSVPKPQSREPLGNAVALNGDHAVVSVPYQEEDESTGIVYIFRLDGGSWHLQAELRPDPGESFGNAAALTKRHLLVSSVHDPRGDKQGFVYIYQKHGSSWWQTGKLTSPEKPGWEFGAAVAVTETGLAYVSDRSAAPASSWNGAVYAFDLDTTSAAHTPGVPEVGGNYPNPFRSVTWLRVRIPEDAVVSVAVYDVLGRRVHRQQFHLRGSESWQSVRLDLPDLPPGVYSYRIGGADIVSARRGSLVIAD